MLIQPKNIAVFERFHVLSPVECRSRYEIMLENYAKTINIEANTMLEMANKQILPALIGFAGDTAAAYNELMCAGVSNATSLRLAQALSDAVDENLRRSSGASGGSRPDPQVVHRRRPVRGQGIPGSNSSPDGKAPPGGGQSGGDLFFRSVAHAQLHRSAASRIERSGRTFIPKIVVGTPCQLPHKRHHNFHFPSSAFIGLFGSKIYTQKMLAGQSSASIFRFTALYAEESVHRPCQQRQHSPPAGLCIDKPDFLCYD